MLPRICVPLPKLHNNIELASTITSQAEVYLRLLHLTFIMNFSAVPFVQPYTFSAFSRT